MIIYCVTNKVNGKRYIGQTTKSLENRWKYHLYAAKQNSDIYFHKAIKKYGVKNFTIEEVAKANSIEELNELEVKYIKEYNTLVPNGYNLQGGGKNKIVHEETRKKISTSNKNKVFSDQHRINLSKARVGKHHSQETKNKISATKKRKNLPPPMLGKKHSEETKEKMSFNRSGSNHPMYGKKATLEARSNMSKAHLGKPHPHKGSPQTEEHKNKISLSNKGGNKTSFKKGHIPWHKGKKGLKRKTKK